MSSFDSYIGNSNLLKQVWAFGKGLAFVNWTLSIQNLAQFPLLLSNFLNPSTGVRVDPVQNYKNLARLN